MSKFRKYGTDPKMDAYVNSSDWTDRAFAAGQGYALDILINDEEYDVRVVVADMGYGLDILINDKEWQVRAEVARQGYGLDILINDEDLDVREEVARQGYGLNVLINDWYPDISKLVSDYLKEHNYKSIAEWAAAEPDKVHKADLQDFKIQEDLKDFIYKIDDSPKLKIESSYDSIDEFFDTCNSSSDDLDELIICTVDTKQPIIKIQKTIKENKTEFKFLVDITDEEGDRFLIQTTIKSKEQLNTKIQETVGALRLYKEFSKYADDLEDCL